MKATGLLGALRNVVEHLAADGRDRRGRAEHDQHLLLGRPERDLLERPFRHDVAALIGLGEKQPPSSSAHGEHGRRDPGDGEAARRDPVEDYACGSKSLYAVAFDGR